MKRFIIGLSFICLIHTFVSCVSRENYIKIEGYAQGGVYSVVINLAGTDVKAEAASDSIDAILNRIDTTLSGYNRGSMLSRFNSGEDIVPNDLFMDAYAMGHKIFVETEGVVDVASAPLFDLWGFGFKTGSMPSDEDVQHVKGSCGMGRCTSLPEIDEEGALNAADVLVAGHGESLPQLNYNAVAQGYSCDLIAQYLYSVGVKDMLVNIGEIYCDGKSPSGGRWVIGIDKPVDGNDELGAQLQGIFKVPYGPHGVVTSGNYRKFYVKDGKKYAHTIDPRTGYPVNHSLLSATVVASDAMTADAYATYCMVVGFEESKKFLAGRSDMEACLVYDEEGEFRVWCTPGFILEN